MNSSTKTFVWDTSAIVNIKEPDEQGYSPGYSLIKDLSDGCIPGPYRNIFPAIAVFEISATVSRKRREGSRILRDFYIVDENSEIYDIDLDLVRKTADLVREVGFRELRGADLIFACIARIEDGYLVTMDNHFSHVKDQINVIDLNRSKSTANYRSLFL